MEVAAPRNGQLITLTRIANIRKPRDRSVANVFRGPLLQLAKARFIIGPLPGPRSRNRAFGPPAAFRVPRVLQPDAERSRFAPPTPSRFHTHAVRRNHRKPPGETRVDPRHVPPIRPESPAPYSNSPRAESRPPRSQYRGPVRRPLAPRPAPPDPHRCASRRPPTDPPQCARALRARP